MINNKNRAIFLDRDGVINKGLSYIYKKSDFFFQEYVFEACKYFQKLGYIIIVVTNQGGIAKGIYTKDDFENLNGWMLEQFRFNSIDITKVYYCPHSYEDNCECKKPKPGMILQAKQEFNIDLENSILIGDQNSDIEAGINAGIKNLYLITTGHSINNMMNVPVLNSLSDLIH